MKKNFKTIGEYIVNFTRVFFLAPIILAKVVSDTVLQLLLAFFHAMYNEREELASAMKEVISKVD